MEIKQEDETEYLTFLVKYLVYQRIEKINGI